MNHILFVTPYYPPEKGAPAVRISETARRLVNRRHQVTVLTTVPNYPSGIVPPEYRGHAIQHEVCDGVNVVRIWSYVSANKGFLRRILAQLSFGFLAPFLGWKGAGHPDVIIVESPPLFDAIAGRLLAWGKHCPFIFTVADPWPEAAIQMGMLRNKVLIRLAEWLEWSTYRRAGRVWVVTGAVRDLLIRRGLSPERIFLVSNGVDTTKFRPLPQATARAELGWGDHFTVIYAGTHGLAHGLTTVLDAAEQLRERTDIRFILVGDGAEKADLIAEAQRRCLRNITFLDPQPHERMPLLLAGADACLIPLRKLPLFESLLPSKLFEAMACARPILLGVDGEARRLAETEAGAAIYVQPENATSLVSSILYLLEHTDEAGLLGKRGRAFVEVHYDRDQLTTILEENIAMLLQKKAPASIPVTLTSVSAAAEKNQSYLEQDIKL